MSDVYIETVEGGETTTPTTHKIELSDGTNSTYITWSNVKAALKTYFDSLYAAITHTHAASDITSGTMATARLGSGSASATTALHGDQTYKTVREVLTAARTYYVRTDGNNSNDGLSNTSGGAFLTIQKAIDTVCSIDMSIYQVTIQVGNGTYTGQVYLKKYLGSLPPIIQGDTTTYSNVLISTTSQNAIYADTATGKWIIQGFKITTTTSGANIRIDNGAELDYKNIEFGAGAGGAHIIAVGGIVSCIGSYSITAGIAYHITTYTNAIWTLSNAATITLTGTPAFTEFISLQRASIASVNATLTFSGSATGKRYAVNLNSTLYSNSVTFPGDTAGTTSDDGVYV